LYPPIEDGQTCARRLKMDRVVGPIAFSSKARCSRVIEAVDALNLPGIM
jgi:hypothetical protein